MGWQRLALAYCLPPKCSWLESMKNREMEHLRVSTEVYVVTQEGSPLDEINGDLSGATHRTVLG